MVVDALAAAAELLLAIVQGIAELSILVLVASARPWRYAFSAGYRSEVDARLHSSGRLETWWFFCWGTLALAGSIGVMAGAVWLVTRSTEDPPAHRVEAAKQIGQALKQKIDAQRDGK